MDEKITARTGKNPMGLIKPTGKKSTNVRQLSSRMLFFLPVYPDRYFFV
jgi:hypothetical protein